MFIQTVRLWVTAVLIWAVPFSSDAAALEPKTDEDRAFYAFGQSMSQQLGSLGLSEHELEMVKAGLTDGVLRRPVKVNIRQFEAKFQEIARVRLDATSAGEKKAGVAFLEKAAQQKGATKTASGLVIQEIKPGTGNAPKASDTVKVHYTGTLIDGTVFDSSVQRGEPATFPLNGVISCWTEGLQRMKTGGKNRLICPSNLAYGDRGAPPKIKPGATLVFEVELLEIVKP